MKFRIKKYPKGWVVEIKKIKWYGKKYWIHFISVAGIESQPWYHTTPDYAMDSLLYEIKRQTIHESRFCADLCNVFETTSVPSYF